MDGISVELGVLLLLVGVLSLAVATIVGRRTPAPAPGRRASVLTLLTPWLGVLLTVVLLGRGARSAALVVVLATAVGIGISRWRAVARGRRRARTGPPDRH